MNLAFPRCSIHRIDLITSSTSRDELNASFSVVVFQMWRTYELITSETKVMKCIFLIIGGSPRASGTGQLIKFAKVPVGRIDKLSPLFRTCVEKPLARIEPEVVINRAPVDAHIACPSG